MAFTIYYFSGTGNSLYLARKLAKQIDKAKIEPLAKYIDSKSIKPKTKSIGFVFPVYFGSMPKLVEETIKKFNLKSVDYCFAVVNMGGLSMSTLHDLSSILKSKKKKLNAGFRIKMPDNYVYFSNIVSKEKQTKIIANAEKEISKIAKKVNEKKNINNNENIITRAVSYFVHKRWAKNVCFSGRYFSVKDSCISCSTCEKVCPVNNITMYNKKPVWHNQCQECLACYHFCPEKAIDYTSKTKKRGQYRNPNITLSDIMSQKEDKR